MPPTPGLPLDPLLPPGGGYGFVPTPPVQTSVGTEAVGTGPIHPGAPAGLTPPDSRLQPQPIQPVVPPLGTQAGNVPPLGTQPNTVPPVGFQFSGPAAPPQVAPAYYVPAPPAANSAMPPPGAPPAMNPPSLVQPAGSLVPSAPAYAPPQLPPQGPVTQVSYQR